MRTRLRCVTFAAVTAIVLGTAPTARAQSLAAEIDKLSTAVEPELIEWRRHLHQNPELSNREVETAKYVAERLRSFGLEPQTGVAKTGVVALLKGGRPGPLVALRADMDALPVREEANVPFASKAMGEYEGNKVGVMHACGHDTHVAILLATARVLSQMKERLPGSVKFLFQPAEEGAPPEEEPAGAQQMVKEGVMQNVDAVFGLHVFANVPTGTITYRSGPFMAAADRFEIIVKGKQTHGSAPWRGVDPIVVGAQIVTALQTIVARRVDPLESAVISVTQFHSGTAENVIPDEAKLVGTVRTLIPAVQDLVEASMRRVVETTAAAHDAVAEFTYRRGYPPTTNHAEQARRAARAAETVLGGRVHRDLPPVMGAEDFSFMLLDRPGAYIKLGQAQGTKGAHEVHTVKYDFNDDLLPVGASFFATLVEQELPRG